MKLIDYEKYAKKSSPKGVVVLLACQTLVTGFFLGLSFLEGMYTHKTWNWVWPLILAFSTGVAASQAMLVALYNCSTPKEKGLQLMSR